MIELAEPGDLIDEDQRLPLGSVVPTVARGNDILLTGATGYLGAFLLHELLEQTTGRVYCVVRAGDEAAAMARLRAAAGRFLLPRPDDRRVHAVPGDLRDIAEVAALFGDGELGRRIGHIVHCATRVVFGEPYRTLREDNVLPTADLLAWARGHGIRDFSYVSSLTAAGPAVWAGNRYLETLAQPLDPEADGYGAAKWVCERLLGRAEQDGMRIRVFRPGLFMASSTTGASNDKDLMYFKLLAGLAIGAHPRDDRTLVMAPVDMVAMAIAGLALSPGSAGRAYHLAAERGISLRALFTLLESTGLTTEPLPPPQWQQRVRELAVKTRNPILAAAALLDLQGLAEGDGAVEAAGWQPWLHRSGLDPRVTGEALRRGIEYLASRDGLARDLVGHLVTRDGEHVEGEQGEGAYS